MHITVLLLLAVSTELIGGQGLPNWSKGTAPEYQGYRRHQGHVRYGRTHGYGLQGGYGIPTSYDTNDGYGNEDNHEVKKTFHKKVYKGMFSIKP